MERILYENGQIFKKSLSQKLISDMMPTKKRSRENSKEEIQEKKPKQEAEEEEEPTVETYEIKEDGLLKWSPEFISKKEAKELYEHLSKELNWVQGDISMYGKTIKTPRIQSWMADENIVVKGLFQRQKQHPWTPQVQKIRERIENLLQCKFDYLLLNLYRDGKDYIGYHADREAIPKGKDIIASVSLGETRKFIIRHKETKEKLEYSLIDGSLIVMEGGNIQKNWKHTVPKQPKVTKPRINLTFRIN
jgi:alkylated DNA repair dioxygenase AlkB